MEHLGQARDHVARGEQLVADQRQLIAELDRDGHDTKLARELLAAFEESQAEHKRHLAMIERELANMDRMPGPR